MKTVRYLVERFIARPDAGALLPGQEYEYCLDAQVEIEPNKIRTP